jgi:hypothetical protein
MKWPLTEDMMKNITLNLCFALRGGGVIIFDTVCFCICSGVTDFNLKVRCKTSRTITHPTIKGHRKNFIEMTAVAR